MAFGAYRRCDVQIRSFSRHVASGLVVSACAIWSHMTFAQLPPIVIGGNDNPDDTGVSVCERDFGSDPVEQWLGSLIRPLCHRNDSDSLLAVYLLSMPGLGSNNGKLDSHVLQRAYARGKSDPKLLWVIMAQSDCAGPIPGCKAAHKAVEAAQALTTADPGNAMAWFALARAHDLAMADPEKVDAALDHAAKAARVHDYTFDLIKLVENASAGIPAQTGLNPDEGRVTFIYMIPMLNERFNEWARNCSFSFDEGDPERKKFCEAARGQFKHGDSPLTLSGDAQATASMKAALQPPSDVSSAEFHKIMLETIPGSASEREWYEKITARLGRTRGGS